MSQPMDLGTSATQAASRVSAVWFVGAMGLLDDAIREHLELKRLRGADPGDVARAEQDVLGPIDCEQGSEPGEQPNVQIEGSSTPDGSSFFSKPGPAPDAAREASTPTRGGQETVEINMEAELARESEREGNAHDEDEPSRSRGFEESKQVEDVLEEIPDFLQDTPEQERLWFEQRPPRDFDFNE